MLLVEVCCVLLFAVGVLLGCCLRFVVCWLLVGVSCCVLCVGCCLVFAVNCLLFVVCLVLGVW